MDNSALIRVASALVLGACMVGSSGMVMGQSFPPGTAREWKRNPPRASVTKTVNSVAPKAPVPDGHAVADPVATANARLTVAQNSVASLTAAAASAQNAADLAQAQLALARADLAAKTVAATTAADAAVPVPAGDAATLQAKQASEKDAKAAAYDAQLSLQAAQADAKTKADAATAAQTALATATAAMQKAQTDLSAAKAAAVAAATVKLADTDIGDIHFAVVPIVQDDLKSDDTVTVSVSKSGDTDFTSDFKTETDCKKDLTGCTKVVVGFHPSASGVETATLNFTVSHADGTSDPSSSVTLTGTGTTTTVACVEPVANFFPLNRQVVGKSNSKKPEIPLEGKLRVDSGMILDTIYCFYGQHGAVSYLGQVKSIYDAAAGTNTVSADVGSLAFLGGVQLALSTNVQTGQSAATTPTTGNSAALGRYMRAAASATEPTLSSTQAAQAAQNLVNGGNFLIRATWPLLYFAPKKTNFSAYSFMTAKEGLDIPNFLAQSTVTSDLESHFNASNEWYAQYDALPATKNADSAGSVFVDGRIGYNYVAHEFAQQSGFGNKTSAVLGQVNAGLIIVGKIRIAAQKNFGPKQQWIDSTTMKPVNPSQNDFASWQLALDFSPSSK